MRRSSQVKHDVSQGFSVVGCIDGVAGEFERRALRAQEAEQLGVEVPRELRVPDGRWRQVRGVCGEDFVVEAALDVHLGIGLFREVSSYKRTVT